MNQLCYTLTMNTDFEDYKNWAHFLQHSKLDHIFSFVFLSFAPIKIILAQSIYLIQPFTHSSKLSNLAQILEEPKTAKLFHDYLLSKENYE
ncbi:MAG: hypothetical protein CL609_07155 [Anaerolineaceae bacterium]|nr:hypothetical protein [Anaerolineaceae bacterium]